MQYFCKDPNPKIVLKGKFERQFSQELKRKWAEFQKEKWKIIRGTNFWLGLMTERNFKNLDLNEFNFAV
jgi:hypothetical protein